MNAKEKVYQIDSDQLGVINFDGPNWVAIHACSNKVNLNWVTVYPSHQEANKKFASYYKKMMQTYFDNELKNEFADAFERFISWIKNEKSRWIENFKNHLYQKSGVTYFKNTPTDELLRNDLEFHGLLLKQLAMENNGHFNFEGFHVSVKEIKRTIVVKSWEE